MQRVSLRVFWAALVSAIGGSFQFGFSTGFVNNTETLIRHYFIAMGEEAPGDDRHFDLMWSLAVSSFALGGLLGTLVFPAVANRVGRKWAILSTKGFCYASYYMIAFPVGWWALCLGRVLIGIGAGGACATVPMYIAEIAPLEARGTLGTMHQLFITIGIAVAQALSVGKWELLGSDRHWHYLMAVPCACTTFMMLLLPGCEDSPVYLLKTRGEERASEALRWFRTGASDEEISAELAAMRLEVGLAESKRIGLREVARDRRLWGPVVVSVGVSLSMQLSGIDAVLYYSTKVLQDAGIAMESVQVYTVLISAVNVLVTIPAMLFMDSVGRKVVQGAGLGGMCLAYITMTKALVMGEHVLAVGAMFAVVCCYAFGPGCVVWFIITELTPIHVRGLATSLGLGANWLANFLVAFMFPHMQASLHSWSFSVFAALTFLLTIFTFACLPETKGRHVAEISGFFTSPDARRTRKVPGLDSAHPDDLSAANSVTSQPFPNLCTNLGAVDDELTSLETC